MEVLSSSETQECDESSASECCSPENDNMNENPQPKGDFDNKIVGSLKNLNISNSSLSNSQKPPISDYSENKSEDDEMYTRDYQNNNHHCVVLSPGRRLIHGKYHIDEPQDILLPSSRKSASKSASPEITSLKRYYTSLESFCHVSSNTSPSKDNIPKAIIQRSLHPEKLDASGNKKDIVELISKIDESKKQALDSPSITTFIGDKTGTKSRKDGSIPDVNNKKGVAVRSQPSHDLDATTPTETSIYCNENDKLASANTSVDSDEVNDISDPFLPVTSYDSHMNFDPGIHVENSFEHSSFHTSFETSISTRASIPSMLSAQYTQAVPSIPYSLHATPSFSQEFSLNQGNIYPENNHHALPKRPLFNNYPLNFHYNNRNKYQNCYFEDEPMLSPLKFQTNSPFSFGPYKNVPVFDSSIPDENPENCSKSILELAKDQHGSRLIQQRLENASVEEMDNILSELSPDETQFVSLMGDVFGNYVIQRLLERGQEKHRVIIAVKIHGYVLSLSLQMYGCRVIQKAIECVPLACQISIVTELEGHVLECIKDQNGNHVIQKCIERIDSLKLSFIVNEIKGQVILLATHPYGCRVIQRVMEHFDSVQKAIVTDELFKNFPILICDQYGNYVLQHILDHCSEEKYRTRIFQYVKDNLYYLSSHKFASNVVEKCLISGSKKERISLVLEIIENSFGIEDDIIFRMMKDPFANYVIQKMLDVIVADKEKDLFYSFISKIKPHYTSLRKINYGKHIISKIDKICSSANTKGGFFSTENRYYSESFDLYKDRPIHFEAFPPYSDNSSEVFKARRNSKCNSIICDSLTEFPCLTRDNGSMSFR